MSYLVGAKFPPRPAARIEGEKMILTGWKEIASRLHCAVRTAQRWERDGLPVNRPLPGHRSCVTADTELLDSWQRDTAFWHRNDFDRLSDIQRSRELRGQAKHEREVLRENLTLLKGQMASLRHRLAWLQVHSRNARVSDSQ